MQLETWNKHTLASFLSGTEVHLYGTVFLPSQSLLIYDQKNQYNFFWWSTALYKCSYDTVHQRGADICCCNIFSFSLTVVKMYNVCFIIFFLKKFFLLIILNIFMHICKFVLSMYSCFNFKVRWVLFTSPPFFF